MAEGGLALFIAAHCSILNCDHLGELCVKQFPDSEAGKGIKMHRTKCTTVICNILSPHFENNLKKSIADQPYSILIDKSTDISVFTSILEKSNSSEDEKKQLKERLVQFLQILLKQLLQQRLPKNVAILQKVSMMSVRNIL